MTLKMTAPKIYFFIFNFSIFVYQKSFLFFSDRDESIRSPILGSTLDSSRNSNNEDQGNLLKGIDKKTVRRDGIEPINRVFTYVLFSVTHFL